MENNFTQDEWSKSFVMIFHKLSERGIVEKKGKFAANVGIDHPSSFNKIVKGSRDFPLHLRQRAMEVLRDRYGVNLGYFKMRSNPMFLTEDNSYDPAGLNVKAGNITISELIQLQKLKEEYNSLKKIVEEKDRTIEAQAELIKLLKEKDK
jgi:hypothetical protein